MNKLMIVAACAAVAMFGGCRSIEIENKGEGKGWSVDVFSHWMNSEADNIAASISPDGTVTFNMNGMKSNPSEEFNKMMNTTFTGFASLARLAAAMCSPGAASIPLTTDAADPEAVAKLVNAQSAAKTAEINAKSQRQTALIKAQSDAAIAEKQATATATPSAAGECTDGSCTAK